MMPVVGVDLGGTKTAAALVGPDGAPGRRLEAPTPAADGPEAVLDTVAELVLRVGGTAPLAGVGIGTAGIVDASGRIISATETFADWVGTDLVAGLRRRLGEVAVAVVNDVDAHALGEAWIGAARGRSSMLMVAVGTGVGGALVIDGRLWRGAHSAAGELGHVPVPGAEGLRCACGRPGHLEALAAGPAIEREYARLTGSPVSGPVVAARAMAGDRAALAVIRAAATGLGRAIAGLVTTVDPECVVVGGGVAQAGDVWWEPFEATCRAELVEAFTGLPIVPAELGQAAALVGAARAVFELGSAD